MAPLTRVSHELVQMSGGPVTAIPRGVGHCNVYFMLVHCNFYSFTSIPKGGSLTFPKVVTAIEILKRNFLWT